MQEIKVVEIIEKSESGKGMIMQMPNWQNMNLELWVGILGFIILLLPAILVKFMAFGSHPILTSTSLVTQQSFLSATVLVGLVFSLYALAYSKNNQAARTIAVIALIVAVVRLLLQ